MVIHQSLLAKGQFGCITSLFTVWAGFIPMLVGQNIILCCENSTCLIIFCQWNRPMCLNLLHGFKFQFCELKPRFLLVQTHSLLVHSPFSHSFPMGFHLLQILPQHASLSLVVTSPAGLHRLHRRKIDGLCPLVMLWIPTMWGTPVISWFINPINIHWLALTTAVSIIHHSYWSYKPTELSRGRHTEWIYSGCIVGIWIPSDVTLCELEAIGPAIVRCSIIQ